MPEGSVMGISGGELILVFLTFLTSDFFTFLTVVFFTTLVFFTILDLFATFLNFDVNIGLGGSSGSDSS